MKIDIGISESHRQAITEGLSHLLADTYTLYMTTHNFHWNVTGPMFNSLHDMFMLQYTELWNAVDPIAERIRSLGHPAPGSYAQFAKLSSLPDAPAQPPKAMQMVAILAQGHEAVARTARGLYEVVEQAKDEPSADLLTQRIAVHEQTAWMLRSLPTVAARLKLVKTLPMWVFSTPSSWPTVTPESITLPALGKTIWPVRSTVIRALKSVAPHTWIWISSPGPST